MKQLAVIPYRSPIGMMDVVLDGEDLVYLDFSDNPDRAVRLLTRRFGEYALRRAGGTTSVHDALEVYFDRGGDPFGKLGLDTGGTTFQRSVWQELRRIPPGRTVDYTTLAGRVGNPRAFRAAASSNALNPIAIIIPCHRVIGRDGTLRGYAGGTERKLWLIEHEQRNLELNAA